MPSSPRSRSPRSPQRGSPARKDSSPRGRDSKKESSRESSIPRSPEFHRRQAADGERGWGPGKENGKDARHDTRFPDPSLPGVWVGGLPEGISDEKVKEEFGKFGTVLDVG